MTIWYEVPSSLGGDHMRSTDAMLHTIYYNTAGELASPAELVGKIIAIGDVNKSIQLGISWYNIVIIR